MNRITRPGAIRTASRGQTMVEYALILAALAVAAFGSMRTTGQKVSSSLKTASAQVGSRAAAGGGVTVSLHLLV